jgi:uncharacterized membrane protein
LLNNLFYFKLILKLTKSMQENTTYQPQSRPLFITVLCIIAFVHVGLSIVLGLFSTIASSIPSAFRAIPYLEDISGMAATLGGLLFSGVSLMLAIIAFFGIIQIWNMLKIGFWTFSISMILFLIAPFVILNLSFNWIFYITLPNLIIIPILILLFAFNLNRLRA